MKDVTQRGAHNAIVIYRTLTADGRDANRVELRPEYVNPKDSLTGLQTLVEGYIERFGTVVFPSKKRADVWANDEGAINGKWHLPTCYIEHPATGDVLPLYGPIVIYRPKGLSNEEMCRVMLVRDIDDTPDFPDIPTVRISKVPTDALAQTVFP